jgi:hypothetical protein
MKLAAVFINANPEISYKSTKANLEVIALHSATVDDTSNYLKSGNVYDKIHTGKNSPHY